MSKRPTKREKLTFKLEHLNDHEVQEVLDYVAKIETKKRDRNNREAPETGEDDLLTLLSAARENHRARQVFEWEAIRRRADARASTKHYA